MISRHGILAVVFLVILLPTVAIADEVHFYDGPQRTKSELATLDRTRVMPLGRCLRIKHIDNKEPPKGSDDALLLPGKHRIAAVYEGCNGFTMRDFELWFKAKAGHTYSVRNTVKGKNILLSISGRVYVWICDTTTRELVAGVRPKVVRSGITGLKKMPLCEPGNAVHASGDEAEDY